MDAFKNENLRNVDISKQIWVNHIKPSYSQYDYKKELKVPD